MKKFLAAILALAMMMAMAPVAFADDWSHMTVGKVYIKDDDDDYYTDDVPIRFDINIIPADHLRIIEAAS